MTEFLEGKYGKVEFGDCRKYLPQISSGTFDLAWIDPPFQVEYGCKSFSKGGKGFGFSEDKVFYKDDIPQVEYLLQMHEVLRELRRVAKCVLVHPGYVNEKMWWDEVAAPDFTLSRIVDNPKNGGDFARLRFRNPILGYGKPPHDWRTDVRKTLVPWGFIPHIKYLHPCPMAADFMIPLLFEAGVQTVYDPMLGSGMVAEAAECLNISWYGNELNSAYRPDIQNRIEVGQKLREIMFSQKTLFSSTKKVVLDFTPKLVYEAYDQLREIFRKDKIIRPKESPVIPDSAQQRLFLKKKE